MRPDVIFIFIHSLSSCKHAVERRPLFCFAIILAFVENDTSFVTRHKDHSYLSHLMILYAAGELACKLMSNQCCQICDNYCNYYFVLHMINNVKTT